MRFLITLLAAFLPAYVAAQSCGTTDLRELMTPEQSAEVAAALADQPYTEGNHWIARRGDDTLHLIGTVHVFDPRLEPVAARLAPLIEGADQLLVEATPDAEAKLQAYLAQNPQLIRIPAPSLIDRLPPAEWQALADAARARGIPPAMAAQLQPWYLSITLAIPPCVMRDMASGVRGLDHMLMATATEAGTPIKALEPWTTVVDIFAADPIEDQIAALRLGVLPEQLANDMMVTLMAQYFDEAHTEVFALSRVLARDALSLDPAVFDPLFDDMLQALLYTRNDNWMPELLAARGTSVVAVGAGHLGGTGGLLDLLAREGFTLERAAF
ncbi:MAG: TraB/GumN family protein [Pseudomonadota bacterium]